jgi:hypothetical protein
LAVRDPDELRDGGTRGVGLGGKEAQRAPQLHKGHREAAGDQGADLVPYPMILVLPRGPHRPDELFHVVAQG